jgi:TatD DNase family protein
MLIDTHCHLTDPDLAGQIDAVLQRAAEAGVGQVITIAETLADARQALELMAGRPAVFLAAGIHPHNAGRCTPDDRDGLAALHNGQSYDGEPARRLVAVGEIGLDFHYDFAPRHMQAEAFRFQLELACQVNRPVVVHAREAEQRVCDILADYPSLAGRVVFHCYSGDTATTRRILDMGFWVSFTGVVTFRNAESTRAVARLVPADRLMVETDAPYLSPEPVRDVRPCEPAMVVHTARRLAEVRSESFAAFATTTTANARRFFNLPESQQ